MRLINLNLTFENCEEIDVPGKYICAFSVADIKKEISRIACNSINMIETCGSFACEIHKDADVPYSPFGNDGDGDETVFKRITAYDDITQIEITLGTDAVYYGAEEPNESNTKTYSYFVNWRTAGGWADCENDYQTSWVSKLGHMYICIAEGKNVAEEFSETLIEDADHIDLSFELCDVGDDNYEEAKRRYMEHFEDDDASITRH